MANHSVLEPPDVRNGAPVDDEPLTDDMALALALMDGELGPAEAAAARARLENDPVCGPMLREWGGISHALFAAFDDAAERAKPELSAVADRVLREVQGTKQAEAAESEGFFARLARFLSAMQAPVAFAAAAAAITFVLLPLLSTTPGEVAPIASHTPPAKTPDPVAPDVKEAPEAKPNDVIVREISFEHADGMVYRTRKGGMTVIWISEHEGA